jgi:hypothetical protein
MSLKVSFEGAIDEILPAEKTLSPLLDHCGHGDRV